MVDWRAAQAQELLTWAQEISSSLTAVVGELADAVSLQEYIDASNIRYERAVDVGAGPLGVGWIGVFGKGSPDRLVALDSLPRIAPSTGRPEVDRFLTALQLRSTYVQARAEDRALEGGVFDLVVCDNVVDHTEQPLDVVRECRRLVRPDGVLLFGVNVFSTVGHIKWTKYTTRRFAQSPNVIMHPHSFVERSATDLLREGGFEVVDRRRGRLGERTAGRSYRFRALARPSSAPRP